MKYLSEYRDANLSRDLIEQIKSTASKEWTLMDVCGGQTHSLIRSGIERELDGVVRLIHGPGCPVCVTAGSTIDFAVALASRPNTILASFGDMLRVPGSSESLIDARARSGQVKVVYSPTDAVKLAKDNLDQEIVLFAVGFETTIPSTAIAVRQAARLGLSNFSLIVAHVRVLPAMKAIMEMEDVNIQGFLAAGHVCVVTGFECYESFSSDYEVPVVVTGFEPVDLLRGILECVRLLESGRSEVANQYGRIVNRVGNVAAKELIDEVYRSCNRHWRGFGEICDGGMALRATYSSFDAEKRFRSTTELPVVESTVCRGADVMSGRIQPMQCPEFGSGCTPESPLGAPMVSSEGACAAYYRYDYTTRT